jgi:hypothetical protein
MAIIVHDTIMRSVTIHTDSTITLQSLQNPNNHNYLIEEIRKSAIALEKRNWTITFTWIKAHVGIYGNERADKLAKEATREDDISFNRIPRNEIVQQLRVQSTAKWQNQWVNTTKGLAAKQFFPIIKDRLTNEIKLTTNLTAIVTAHGKTKAYLHRFKITESPECPCNSGNQTVDHLLYDCIKLQREREELIRNISNQDKWPVNKSDLVNKHTKHFTKFVNSIDFERLSSYKATS